jgi:hypothetical protein
VAAALLNPRMLLLMQLQMDRFHFFLPSVRENFLYVVVFLCHLVCDFGTYNMRNKRIPTEFCMISKHIWHHGFIFSSITWCTITEDEKEMLYIMKQKYGI